MSLWRQLTHGVRRLARPGAAAREVSDEIAQYLDEAIDQYVARGLSPAEARRAALAEMGSTAAVAERVRDSGWEHAVSAFGADLRLAARMLRKSPVFTLVVVFVIALGSGAVSTIFSAMNALVLRPIPGVDGAGLVAIRPARRDGSVADQASYGTYAHLREHARTLDGIAAWGRVALTIAARGKGAAVLGNMVSANYFDVLRVRPVRGRFFLPEENRTPLSHPVIVVSHAFWTGRLDGDEGAIGRAVVVNGNPYTLVGVAPAGFRGIYTGLRADAWVPLMMQAHLRPRSNLTTTSWLWLIGRLHEGSDPPAAKADLSALAVDARGPSGDPRSLAGFDVAPLTGLPNGEGGPLLTFMGLLLGAAVLVLLIAGVNVAAMLSARYAARGRELAVRAALGAGRQRLIRQLLTEILALFAAGGLGGVIIAALATAALERLPLPANVPLSLELSPDWRVLAFALATSLAAGLAFGLAPALGAARNDITPLLRDDSARAGVRRTLVSRTVVAGQLALSLLLLVGAGLFLRALGEGHRVDPGFDLSGVTTTSLEPESWGYDQPRAREFYRALRERMEAVPGVTAVSCTSRLPLMMSSSPADVTLEDGATLTVHTASVDVGYFDVLRLPVVHGRAFLPADDERAPRVAVVNQTLARKLRPDGAVLDGTFRFRGDRVTIVGIARDAKYASLDEGATPFAYFPVAQLWPPAQALLVRSGDGAADVVPAIRHAVLSIDPLLPQPRIATLAEATSIVLLPQRAAAIVTGVLGGVGLLLASVGLYGILAFTAAQRAREIGIRAALGATRTSNVGLIVRDGVRLAGTGIAIGLVLAAMSTRLLSAWLFGVNPLDPIAFAVMSVLFLAVALLASYLPARRAAALDPVAALRAD